MKPWGFIFGFREIFFKLNDELYLMEIPVGEIRLGANTTRYSSYVEVKQV